MDNKIGRACGMHKARREVYKILTKNLKERWHLEDLEVDGSKFIKIYLKLVGRTWAGLIWPRI